MRVHFREGERQCGKKKKNRIGPRMHLISITTYFLVQHCHGEKRSGRLPLAILERSLPLCGMLKFS